MYACGHFRINFPTSIPDDRFVVSKTMLQTDPDFNLQNWQIEWADIIWLQRPTSDPFVSFVDNVSKNTNKLVLISCDDQIPLSDRTNPCFTALNKDAKDTKNFHKILASCDGITTSSVGLVNFYSKFNSNILLVRNAIDKKFPGYHTRNDNLKLIDGPKQNLIDKGLDPVVVYFGGGSSHYRNLMILKDVIPEVAKRCPNMLFALAGNKEFFDIFANVPEEQKVWLNFVTNFHDAQNYPSVADIQLAPLENNNMFNHCKTVVKFLEAAMYRNAPIASNLQPFAEFRDLAEPGRPNCVIVERNSDPLWIDALTKMIKDDDYRNKLAINCQETVERHYNLEKLARVRYDWFWEQYWKKQHNIQNRARIEQEKLERKLAKKQK